MPFICRAELVAASPTELERPTDPDCERSARMCVSAGDEGVIGREDIELRERVGSASAGGGNPGLQGDGTWTPFSTTPNHPEFPSAHNCFTGAVTTLAAGYFGTTRIHLAVDSLAFQDGAHTHTFEDTRDLLDEVFWARIYGGMHFYHSVEDGRQLGATIARETLRTHFRPQQSGLDYFGNKSAGQ